MDIRRATSEEDLLVSVRSAEQDFHGIVVDAHSSGDGARVEVDFPYSEAPKLPIGERVTLDFTEGGPGGGFQGTGEVVFQSVDPVRHRYQFQFGPQERAVLTLLVNRRSADRIHPDSCAPLATAVRCVGGEPVEVIVKDVSSTGISVLVPRAQEPLLFSSWDLAVLMELPEGDERLELPGLVHYRRLSGSSILYGIGFEPSAARDRLIAFLRGYQTLVYLRRKRA